MRHTTAMEKVVNCREEGEISEDDDCCVIQELVHKSPEVIVINDDESEVSTVTLSGDGDSSPNKYHNKSTEQHKTITVAAVSNTSRSRRQESRHDKKSGRKQHDSSSREKGRNKDAAHGKKDFNKHIYNSSHGGRNRGKYEDNSASPHHARKTVKSWHEQRSSRTAATQGGSSGFMERMRHRSNSIRGGSGKLGDILHFQNRKNDPVSSYSDNKVCDNSKGVIKEAKEFSFELPDIPLPDEVRDVRKTEIGEMTIEADVDDQEYADLLLEYNEIKKTLNSLIIEEEKNEVCEEDNKNNDVFTKEPDSCDIEAVVENELKIDAETGSKIYDQTNTMEKNMQPIAGAVIQSAEKPWTYTKSDDLPKPEPVENVHTVDKEEFTVKSDDYVHQFNIISQQGPDLNDKTEVVDMELASTDDDDEEELHNMIQSEVITTKGDDEINLHDNDINMHDNEVNAHANEVNRHENEEDDDDEDLLLLELRHAALASAALSQKIKMQQQDDESSVIEDKNKRSSDKEKINKDKSFEEKSSSTSSKHHPKDRRKKGTKRKKSTTLSTRISSSRFSREESAERERLKKKKVPTATLR